MKRRFYRDREGELQMGCPNDYQDPPLCDFGSTDDPQQLYDHIVKHHSIEEVARWFLRSDYARWSSYDRWEAFLRADSKGRVIDEGVVRELFPEPEDPDHQ